MTGAAALGVPLLDSHPAAASRRRKRRLRQMPLRHIVVDCQENHSFDNYYGYAPWIGRYGVPHGYSQPDGQGGSVAPYHLSTPTPGNPNEGWAVYHGEWSHGSMDGFYTNGGNNALGYYTGRDLPFYYSLHKRFTLCVNYFCSTMTETYPNRLYLTSGTSGGITDNSVYGYGVLDYPCILDLLDAAGVTWKVYNLGGVDTLSHGLGDNVFLFFKRYANDRRALKLTQDYLDDAKRGTLPNVSFMVPSFVNHLDEHPPANVQTGMDLQRQTITALMRSPLWKSAVYIHTYDEHGGFFEHVRPPQLDAYGLGMRVPTWVISPYAKPEHLEPTVYEHSSILKFIETVFDLPTLASVNRRFDHRTPGGLSNAAANGANYGPPAPPRDGRHDIGALMECFDFSRRAQT